MDSELRNAIEYRLRPDEQPVWAGRPVPARHLFPDGVAIAHFVLWGLWLILSLSTASSLFEVFAGPPPEVSRDIPAAAVQVITPLRNLSILSSALFLGIGLWQVAAPLRRLWVARHLIYVVTPERAVILRGKKVTPFRSYNRPAQQAIKVVEKNDGSGDILFERRPSGFRALLGLGTRICGFQGLEDVSPALGAIRQIRTDRLF